MYVTRLLVNFQSFRSQFASRPAILIIQRNFLKIQRKNLIDIILNIFAKKQIILDVLRIWLHFLGHNASFDTHIDIFMNGTCHMSYVINAINGIFDMPGICVMSSKNMSIWVSKEALSLQESSQMCKKSNTICFSAKIFNMVRSQFFLCIF